MNLKENIKHRLRSKLYEMTVGDVSSKEQLGTETQSIPQKQDPRTLNVQQGMNRQSPNYGGNNYNYRRGTNVPRYGTPNVLIPPYDDWNGQVIRFIDEYGVDTIMSNPYLRNTPDIGSVDSDLENRDVTGEQGGEGEGNAPVYEPPFNPKILDEMPNFVDSSGNEVRIITNPDGSVTIISGNEPPYMVWEVTKQELEGGLGYMHPMLYDPNVGYFNPVEYWNDEGYLDLGFQDVYPGWNPLTGDPPPGGTIPAGLGTPAGEWLYNNPEWDPRNY